MLIYPAYWRDTITVYCKSKSSSGEITWFKYTLSETFFQRSVGKVISGAEATSTPQSTYLARIPKQASFKERYEWEALTSAQKANYFTLSPEDIVVNGDVADVINEYVTGSNSNDLLTKYKSQKGVFRIQTVKINTAVELPHYFVTGA